MKRTDGINDAIGGIDEAFVEEYLGGTRKKNKVWIKWTAAAASFVVVLSALIVPYAMRKVPDKSGEGDGGTAEATVPAGMVGLEPISETIKDAEGRDVLHVKNAKAPEGTIVEQNYALDWPATSYCFMTHDTPTLLAVKGIKVSSDSYTYERKHDDGTVYEYTFYVSGIQITDMLKENNSSPYREGDVIYVFNYLTAELRDDEERVYFSYGDSRIPPKEESVYLLSTSENKSYIPEFVKSTGLVDEDVWNVIGVTSPEEFEEIWQSVVENWDYYKENF
ncbi:MAG: hypothetical protein IJ038_05370 [Clostridia bacterium]|nr:hypothetical protein [Clostridia bacterium]